MQALRPMAALRWMLLALAWASLAPTAGVQAAPINVPPQDMTVIPVGQWDGSQNPSPPVNTVSVN
jgi:hypothetical protein